MGYVRTSVFGSQRKTEREPFTLFPNAMFVTGLETCYFVVSGQMSTVQVVEKDPVVCQDIVRRCLPFYVNSLLSLSCNAEKDTQVAQEGQR